MQIISFSEACNTTYGSIGWSFCYSGGECVRDTYFCDGDNDCYGDSDESFCDGKHRNTLTSPNKRSAHVHNHF